MMTKHRDRARTACNRTAGGTRPLAALALLCLAVTAGEAAADDRALLIGIGNYRIEAANLPGVDEDLNLMREVARTLGFADSQIKVLADSAATLGGIRQAISDWLVDGTTAGDRVLFYHSGHGTRVPDASGDEADGSDEALLPYDFTETPVAGDEKRLGNVLVDDELGRLLGRIPAREVVALVDSCHSGTMTRSLGGTWHSKFYVYRGIPKGTENSIADRALERRGSVVLLSAAQPEEDAQTSERGALFTQGVWKAVREAEPRRRLTLEQLQSATERFIRQGVGSRRDLIHRPMLSGRTGLRSINLFLPPGGAQVAATTPAPAAPMAPAPAGELPSSGIASELWQELETLVRDARQTLAVTASKSLYRAGESLELTVTAPSDGYLHILNVGDREQELVVLYPNLYQADNYVKRGQTVSLPSFESFTLPARLPSDRIRQENLVVVIHTPKRLFLGDRPPQHARELFRVIRHGEFTRSITRQPLTPAYAAGQVVVAIGL